MPAFQHDQIYSPPAWWHAPETLHTALLQRTCACGASAGIDGVCAGCRSKQLASPTPTLGGSLSTQFPAQALVQEAAADSTTALDASVRGPLEQHLGHDFSQVRVHHGAASERSAQQFEARAYTLGRDIYLGAEAHQLNRSEYHQLLAHEAVHTVQQGSTSVAPPERLEVSGPGDVAEVEANQLARSIMATPGPARSPSLALGDQLRATPIAPGAISRRAAPLIQRAPAPRRAPMTELDLPWAQGDLTLFEVTVSGIRVLAGVNATKEKTIRAVIPSIAKQIANANALIGDPAFQVKLCFIVPTTTRFALFGGIPVLMLDPTSEADSTTAAHEMGHAIFHYLTARSISGAPDASKAENFLLRIAAIYHQLANTKMHTAKAPDGHEETHAVGHWIVDPSQWKPGSKFEHPWDDPDEFFASAKEAYQADRAGLSRTIARFTKIDSKVGIPAKQLLDLLDAFLGKGNLPTTGLPKAEKGTAVDELMRVTAVSRVEDTVIAGSPLDLLLNPDDRPQLEAAKPSVSAPPSGHERAEQPNLVTGPGGVKEQMEERMRERMRQKILESVHEIP
jgi:hypothetical protein